MAKRGEPDASDNNSGYDDYDVKQGHPSGWLGDSRDLEGGRTS